MKTSSIAVETSRSTTQSDSIVRQTNKRSSYLSYTTMNNKHIFNDISFISVDKLPLFFKQLFQDIALQQKEIHFQFTSTSRNLNKYKLNNTNNRQMGEHNTNKSLFFLSFKKLIKSFCIGIQQKIVCTFI